MTIDKPQVGRNPDLKPDFLFERGLWGLDLDDDEGPPIDTTLMDDAEQARYLEWLEKHGLSPEDMEDGDDMGRRHRRGKGGSTNAMIAMNTNGTKSTSTSGSAAAADKDDWVKQPYSGGDWGERGIKYHSGGGYSSVSWEACRHYGYSTIVTLSNGVRLHGADREGIDPTSCDLVLDLANNLSYLMFDEFVATNNPKYRGLNQHVVKPDVLQLDWRDMSIPPVGLAFWEQLLTMTDGLEDVTATCFGGHGRTGTCLASLLIADGWSADMAIDHIRAHHCRRAIETKGQEDYLYGLELERQHREQVASLRADLAAASADDQGA